MRVIECGLAAVLMGLTPMAAAAGIFRGITEEPIACEPKHSMLKLSSLGELPAPVYQDFLERAGPIADIGQRFNPTDVENRSLPTRRFVRAFRAGRKIIVWYEHGGTGLHMHVVEYEVFDGDGGVVLLSNVTTFKPCAATDVLLDGVMDAVGHW